MRQKRLRFPRNRWIRLGQRVTDGITVAEISRINAAGVTVAGAVGQDSWAATFTWHAVFRARGAHRPLVRVWRPL